MKEPHISYNRRIKAYEKLLKKQKQTADRLSNYRLGSVILGLAVAFLIYRTFNPSFGLSFGLSFGFFTLILFGYLAFQHKRILAQIKASKILIRLNHKGLKRLTGDWVDFSDSGEEFNDESHPYASDLDFFGQGSFFQWINSTHTPMGCKALANMLKQPLKERSLILERQAAVDELARKLNWRQHFELEGILLTDDLKPSAPLLQWAEESNTAYLQPSLKLGVRILPILTFLMIVLSALKLSVPWQIPMLLVLIQWILLRLYGKSRSHILSTVYRYEASIKTYAQMLKHLERQPFTSPLLNARLESLRDRKGKPAYQQIQKLSQISERISNRENALFLVINILTLWDYQCMIALEEWKKESGKRLRLWLEVLAEFEALSSLANIRFDNPEWTMPVIDNQNGLSVQKMGHPLLTQKRVCNSFEMKPTSSITLITGSNMSGKSTFLRTVGSNLILAYIGAPVCAEKFSCSRMNLWTCMRVSDNLEQSISSFYAEILRIKQIVEAAKTDKPVFFLLDEIFKGTNSHDRHFGAKALIKQLQTDGAFGLISTHDLELGELEKECNGRIKNFHFREYYQNNEIRFDYTLREGISTTRNALYLIKMAGIKLEEDI